jgi:ring-1,2-phenylacetyl-CoA epoxidase subunit PaaE
MEDGIKQLTVSEIITEAPDTKTFVLLPRTAGDSIAYKAGQFLTFLFDEPHAQERRSYSIASAPLPGIPLSITVKRVDNGIVSRRLIDRTQVGDTLRTIGASGFFTLPDNIQTYKQVFFFAAGSGITPIYSLIRFLLYHQPEIKVVLIYSNRSAGQVIFKKELDALEAQYPGQFQLEYLYSTAPNLARARLSKWLLEILIKEYSVAPFAETLYYLCGPFDYMRMATIGLVAQGVPAANIRKENFTPFLPEIKAQPPDKEAHRVQLQLGKRQYELQVQYPQSILQAAKRQGIPLPYSCEAGRCGTCAAICTSGKVWMSYNEVLPDKEVADGRVLTCTGYPVGGDVQLRFTEI